VKKENHTSIFGKPYLPPAGETRPRSSQHEPRGTLFFPVVPVMVFLGFIFSLVFLQVPCFVGFSSSFVFLSFYVFIFDFFKFLEHFIHLNNFQILTFLCLNNFQI
jgi:hypothetical protein